MNFIIFAVKGLLIINLAKVFYKLSQSDYIKLEIDSVVVTDEL